MRRSDKVPVSRRALLARLNRKISPRQIRAARSEKSRQNLGEFYIVDRDRVVLHNVNLDSEARRLRVLRDYELIVG